jgi:hypothetical protein
MREVKNPMPAGAIVIEVSYPTISPVDDEKAPVGMETHAQADFTGGDVMEAKFRDVM